MDLMYMNHDREDLGVLKNPAFDLAFGEDENNFECKISLKDHCCKEGFYIYAEGTEYGGIVDAIEIDSENDIVIYTGRSWHGILASKVIEPLKSGEPTTWGETGNTPRLPEGYTELKWIKSTGTQYINSGLVLQQGGRVVFKGSFPLTSDTEWLFGARVSSKSAMYGFVKYNSQYRFDYGTENHYFTAKNAEAVDLNAGTCTVNETETITATAQTFNPNCNIFLFANNNAGTAAGFAKDTIAESFKMYKGGKLSRDYVPCKTPDGKIGMYDLVTAEFYGNAGTGEFIAGDEVIYETTLSVNLNSADVGRYLTISGDANACIAYLAERVNIAPLFTAPEEVTKINISAYQFERYIDAYSGLCDMLASCGMRLAITCKERTVMLSAVPIFDFSDGKELESDLIEYQMKKTYNNVNHLICVGSGKYENRQVVHLYLDAEGNVSETQTFFGENERIQFDGEQDEPEETETKTAEQIAEERASLIESGTKKLLDLQAEDEIDVSFDATEDNYYIGDIVGAYDSVTDISVSAAVVKKIISIANSKTNIEYKVGAKQNG